MFQEGHGVLRCRAPGSAEGGQDVLQSATDEDINNRKEHRCQRGKDEHHNRGEHDLATGGPDDLGDFGTHLLDELRAVVSGQAGFPVYERLGGCICQKR